MKRVLIALIAGTVLSGIAAAYASAQVKPVGEAPSERATARR